MTSRLRMPGLDGFRAISIVLVMIGHLHLTRGYGASSLYTELGDLAHLGVEIFFVISGFLITTLLLEERERTNGISLGRFYLRRSLRIFPAFLAYLAVLICADLLGLIHLSGRDIATAATYTVNYNIDRSWYIGHLWSLSVEEQFYLLWPAALLWASANTRHGAIVIATATFFVAPAVRLTMHAMMPNDPARDLEIFPAVADAIAAGCLIALMRDSLLRLEWYRRATSSGVIWLCLIPVILVNKYAGYTLVDAFGSPLALALIAMLIETGSRRTRGPVATMLNWPPVVFIGILSYSLYLWQQPFLNRHCSQLACSFPLNLVLAAACAVASYLLLERPLVGLRKRFSSSRTPVSSSELPMREQGS
jgi:peptidoglycan/LPS O-acetylase OafA/YrhL